MTQFPIYLTKTKFITGLICKKRLYLTLYRSKFALPLSSAELARLKESNKIGKIARKLFPGGRLIKSTNNQKALFQTQKALQHPQIDVIYEPAFLYEGIFIRVDILVRAGKGFFDLIEIKSSSKIKKYQPEDLAFQYYVLTAAGLNIRNAYIYHLHKDYTYSGSSYRLKKLFKKVDLTEQIIELQPSIIKEIASIKKLFSAKKSPQALPGKHCKKPYVCQYIDYCMKGLEYPVTELPRISDTMLEALKKLKIKEINSIPQDLNGLTELQQRVRDAVHAEVPFLKSGMKEKLENIQYPIYFLDFESFNPALPLYKNTKPYQMIPFQWSVHILSRKGGVKHKEYLHISHEDPHQAFACSLIKVLRKKGAILVYSNFESTRIKGLMKILPGYSKELKALLSRIIDLQQIIRTHCYYPEFHGSYSLKNVLPVLIPDLTYEGLEISNGALAAHAYQDIIDKYTPIRTKKELISQLLDYCKRDTEAMLELYKYFIVTLSK
jgi:predicted RecB family nuclease